MRHWTVQEIMQVANAGGGLDVYARRFTAQEAMQIAHAVADSGGTITFRDCRHWTSREAMQIAHSGPGHVVFADPPVDP